MQDAPKAVWSIVYVSVVFFPSVKQNFIAFRSSKVSDCIFEIHQLWQWGFSRVYSNRYCSRSFEAEIIKICLSFHNMYSNNILTFQESMTILNAHTKKVWKPIECITYIYTKDDRQGFGVKFLIMFPVREWNVATEDEVCLIIVRNLWCCDLNTSTFDIHWSLLKIWVRPSRRWCVILCDQWIFWMRASIALNWRHIWTHSPLQLVWICRIHRLGSHDYESPSL